MSTHFWNMPDKALNEARAEVADFLFQNPRNFRFSTTILNNALTLSFHQGPFSPLIDGSKPPISSPSYSPLPWDESSVNPTSPIVTEATRYVSVADSHFDATSKELRTGHLSSDLRLRDILPVDSLINGYPTGHQKELKEDSTAGEWPGEFSTFFSSLPIFQVPYTTENQDGTILAADPSTAKQHALGPTSSLDLAHSGTDPPAQRSLIPPIAYLLDELLSNSINNHLSSNSIDNRLSSNSIDDDRLSSNSTHIKPLLRHETLLIEGDTLGTIESSCISNQENLYIEQTAAHLEDGKIDQAFNEEPGAKKENIQVLSAPSSIASTPPPSSNSTQSLLQPASVRDSVSNDYGPFDVFFVHPTLNKDAAMHSDPNPFTLTSVFPPTPQNSKASLFIDEAMPFP
ncbi:hypothetical protein EDB19DRAFT_1910606 [Suillus lakei]|nr:hypothetical protein EDB19DRAFT_1910606 [Suillus lakei]